MKREAAEQLALAKWLVGKVKEWEQQAKADLDAIPGQREPIVLGGITVGTVSQENGARTPRVVDEEAFLAWVQDTAPDEVEVIPARFAVRAAYRTKILDQVKKRGALLDEDGVVIDGIVELGVGEPKSVTRLNEEADIVIGGLLANGRIGATGLKAIGAPGNSSTQENH